MDAVAPGHLTLLSWTIVGRETMPCSHKLFERGTPEARRQPTSDTGSSESLGVSIHSSPRLNDDETINGPEDHESDPVHVMHTPRALHPRRLELPNGVNNLGKASQIRQGPAIAEEAQLERVQAAGKL
uniref:Uncharacterized protein n=1 Tax=Ascaris lumbricoides TaxID=6252 RepID=A0A0M3HVV1_ASCLU